MENEILTHPVTVGEHPAFAGPSDTGYQAGLSKREWFAGRALSGLLAGGVSNTGHKYCSERAVKLADHLIEALNEPLPR